MWISNKFCFLLQCLFLIQQALVTACSDRDLFPDPTTVVCDFELAVINVVKEVLGDHISIQGFFYHLSSLHGRKSKNWTSVLCVKKNASFRLFCMKIDALAFLPDAALVKRGMFHLKSIAPPQGMELLQYFDSTYVSGTYRNLGGRVNGIKLQSILPRFPPATWNVHHATLNNDARKNNICEGWNNKMYHLVNKKHWSIWSLIESIKLEEATAYADMLKFDNLGVHPKPKTCRIYIQMQEHLRNLCLEFVAGTRSMETFLTAVANNIHKNKTINN